MKFLIASLLMLFSSVSMASDLSGSPWQDHAPPPDHPFPKRCVSRGHWEWRSVVLRRYWIVLPCGSRELWEDILIYRIFVPGS